MADPLVHLLRRKTAFWGCPGWRCSLTPKLVNVGASFDDEMGGPGDSTHGAP